jgi:hypothetical protein
MIWCRALAWDMNGVSLDAKSNVGHLGERPVLNLFVCTRTYVVLVSAERIANESCIAGGWYHTIIGQLFTLYQS